MQHATEKQLEPLPRGSQPYKSGHISKEKSREKAEQEDYVNNVKASTALLFSLEFLLR